MAAMIFKSPPHCGQCSRSISADIVQRLNTEIAAVLAQPDTHEKLASQGLDAKSTTPDEFARILSADVARWAKLVQKLGLKVE